MFHSGTPESVGLDAKYLRRFMERLTRKGVNLHSCLMARGDTLFFEKYAAPFTAETPHRMYSVTKTFVGLAIGCLIDEGKLSLDDTFVSFYPELSADADPIVKTQTIRDMLMMRTCFAGGASSSPAAMRDRLNFYLHQKPSKYPGTIYDYDSAGSHMLAILAEDLSGMPLLAYLKTRLLDQLGDFENADMLLTPDLHAWGSSALICKPRGLLNTIRFLLNGGTWEGKRLLSESFVRTATRRLTDNDPAGIVRHDRLGYGYQMRVGPMGSFSLNGMAGQFAVGVPSCDFSFVCTADTQLSSADDMPRIFDALFEEIVPHLPGAAETGDGWGAIGDGFDLEAPLTLPVARGSAENAFFAAVDGKTYVCAPNPMGIRRFSLRRKDDAYVFAYENDQGEKELAFGMKKNVTGFFPQYGYSDRIGFLHEITDFRYVCRASAGWLDERTLQLKVQITDKYFGMLSVTFGWLDEKRVSVCMMKDAQDFLDEYSGWMTAEAL